MIVLLVVVILVEKVESMRSLSNRTNLSFLLTVREAQCCMLLKIVD